MRAGSARARARLAQLAVIVSATITGSCLAGDLMLAALVAQYLGLGIRAKIDKMIR